MIYYVRRYKDDRACFVAVYTDSSDSVGYPWRAPFAMAKRFKTADEAFAYQVEDDTEVVKVEVTLSVVDDSQWMEPR